MQYRKIGEAQKHVYGERGTGAPNYNLSPEEIARKAQQAKADADSKAAAEKPSHRSPPRSRRSNERIRRRIRGTVAQKDRVSKFNVAAIIGISLAAILFQVYVPRFVTYLSYLELPLLVTVYFSLMRRSPMAGVFFGAAIGLAQDSLVAASVGDVRHRQDAGRIFRGVGEPALRRGESRCCGWCWRFSSSSFTNFFIGCCRARCWARRSTFDPQQTLMVAMLNAVVAVPLFHLLDKLKVTG